MNAFFVSLNFVPLNPLTILMAAVLVACLYLCFLAPKWLAPSERQPEAPATGAADFPSKPEPAPQPNSSERTNPKIIHLSSNVPAPSSAQEMSQQAKIAAALTRAGLAGPATRPEQSDHQSD